MNHSDPQALLPNSPVPGVATELLVSGMTCNNCARHVTEAIQGVRGVRSATVALETQRATVRWDLNAPADVPAVLAAVRQAGYEAKAIDTTTHDRAAAPSSGWRLNLWLGVLATTPLIAGEWIFGLGLVRWFQWVAFVLAGAVQLVAGAPFYRGAWRQLRMGRSNMDTLVALGSSTAFGYSVWALFSGHGGHLYFMEAAAIITLISVGHWIEARVSARASDALKSLLNLAPQTARLRHPDGRETEVAVAELKPGHLLTLKPGDRVPTDGMVSEGNSAVDESMLTGEVMPVDKSSGDKLYAGTVNRNGRLVMRVTATGESTALAHIIAAVQRAQSSRAAIQRLGDRVSSVFVPVVVGIAVAAGWWWGAAPESAARVHDWLGKFLWPVHLPLGDVAVPFIIAAAVLIIACPCAMGLATPTAIMAGSNAAARRGILVRDGVALEKAGRVTAVIFDKTGTLTSGELALTGPWTPDNTPDAVRLVQQLAAALAQPSNHPVSKVLARLADTKPELLNWRETPGSGVQAELRTRDGNLATARLGSLHWLQSCGIPLPAEGGLIEQWKAEGAMLVGVASGDALLGIFALKDIPKPHAARVVHQLQRQGLHTFLLTGDHPRTAAAVASQVGIAAENIFAKVRPEQKADFVKQLQLRGERVAFVGDGINDAPALEQADLGIAVARASDIAREAADIILLRSEIEAVPEALGLARATLRTIKQNLFWAFLYNALGVPLAALGFLSPMLCAAAMGASDLIVIGNALRLRRWRLNSGQ
jgi:Cu+-exporting ATPase